MERERERKTQQNLVHTRWLELHDLKYTIKRKEISSQRQQQRTKSQKKIGFHSVSLVIAGGFADH